MKFGLHGRIPWFEGAPGLLARQGNLCHPEKPQKQTGGTSALGSFNWHYFCKLLANPCEEGIKDFHRLTRADQGGGERQSQHLVNQLGLTLQERCTFNKAKQIKRRHTQNLVFSARSIPFTWALMMQIPSIFWGCIFMQPEECAQVQGLAPAQSGGE